MSSVFAQSYGNIEYIVVDGGSTDGTVKIIRNSESRLKDWVSERDRGIYDGMNKGIAMCSGELIGLLNASDCYVPEAVERVVKEFARTPDGGVFHGNVRMLNADGSLFKVKKPKIDDDWFYEGMTLFHPSFFVKRSVYEACGMFDHNFMLAADFDFALRCSLAGVKFCYIDEVMCEFRKGGISSRRETEAIRECRNALLKNGVPEAKADEVERRLLRRGRKNRRYEFVYNLLRRCLPEAVVRAAGKLFSVK
jgi:glycosyltransferase involved in cell wall biosynthesis